MRAENEINAEEYALLKKDMGAEFERLAAQEKNLTEQDKLTTDFAENLRRIEKALKGLCDGSDKELTLDYMGQLIESVVPESNSRFIWSIRTGADKIIPLHANIGGRKNNAIISVDEFTEEGGKPSVHKKSRLFDRLRSSKRRNINDGSALRRYPH